MDDRATVPFSIKRAVHMVSIACLALITAPLVGAGESTPEPVKAIPPASRAPDPHDGEALDSWAATRAEIMAEFEDEEGLDELVARLVAPFKGISGPRLHPDDQVIAVITFKSKFYPVGHFSSVSLAAIELLAAFQTFAETHSIEDLGLVPFVGIYDEPAKDAGDVVVAVLNLDNGAHNIGVSSVAYSPAGDAEAQFATSPIGQARGIFKSRVETGALVGIAGPSSRVQLAEEVYLEVAYIGRMPDTKKAPSYTVLFECGVHRDMLQLQLVRPWDGN